MWVGGICAVLFELNIMTFFWYTACDPLLLGDNTSLSGNMSCDSPYHSLGIDNGIACYSGISIGSSAFYYCLKCGFTTIKGTSVRTCLPNGSWNGSIPQCNCDIHAAEPNYNDSESESLDATSRTVLVITKYLDNELGKNQLFYGIYATSGALLVGIVIIIIVLSLLIAFASSKRKLKRELHELQERVNPIYEDVDFNPKTNTAYIPTYSYPYVFNNKRV